MYVNKIWRDDQIITTYTVNFVIEDKFMNFSVWEIVDYFALCWGSIFHLNSLHAFSRRLWDQMWGASICWFVALICKYQLRLTNLRSFQSTYCSCITLNYYCGELWSVDLLTVIKLCVWMPEIDTKFGLKNMYIQMAISLFVDCHLSLHVTVPLRIHTICVCLCVLQRSLPIDCAVARWSWCSYSTHTPHT